MKYTVVLLRPDYIAEDSIDPYVALVEEQTKTDAIYAAQLEVFKGDKLDKLDPKSHLDYAFVVMFAGHHEPVMWAWQQ